MVSSLSLMVRVVKGLVLCERRIMHRLLVTGRMGRLSLSTSSLLVLCMRRFQLKEMICFEGGPTTSQ